MATLEERIAALEAMLAALGTPDDYYVSRYSGEEIDAFLAAAQNALKLTKLYSSVSAMTEDYSGTDVAQGQFVGIAPASAEDADYGKIYVKDSSGWVYWTTISTADGIQGPQGLIGPKGDTGATGKSAYQSAVEAGYSGTDTAFNAALKNLAEHDSAYLKRAGGTMTGNLVLNGAPTSSLMAATKKYVDDSVGLKRIATFSTSLTRASARQIGTVNLTSWSGLKPLVAEVICNGPITVDNGSEVYLSFRSGASANLLSFANFKTGTISNPTTKRYIFYPASSSTLIGGGMQTTCNGSVIVDFRNISNALTTGIFVTPGSSVPIYLGYGNASGAPLLTGSFIISFYE